MNYMVDQYRGLYDKAYQDAVKANEAGNLPVAHKKMTEAVMFLKKLATLDPTHKDTYLQRAEKLSRIAAAIQTTIDKTKPVTGQSQGGVNQGQQSPKPTFAEDEGLEGEDMSSYYTFFSADDLTGGFDKVIGLEEAKEAVTQYVINPIRYPEAYNYNFLDNKCILLEGPPGTGKTTFAKAVAKEIDQPFVLVNLAALVNCYIGETAKNIDKIFNSLRAYAEKHNCGMTVFFDEFDEIAKRRDGDDKASQSAVPALLRNLDGVKGNKNFLIIANTNCQEMLDTGIKDRFRRRIHIPLPDEKMRARFFTDKLAQVERECFDQLDIAALAKESEGLSGRAISQICDDFLYFMGAVKAGIKTCDNYNEVLINMIHRT